MPHNTDPFTGYNFMVALGDIGGEDQIAGGFHEVEGLGVSIDEVEYRVGNEKSSGVRKIAGLRRYLQRDSQARLPHGHAALGLDRHRPAGQANRRDHAAR